MAEIACKLCKPREHSFAKDGRKTSWTVVQNSGLRQKLEDDYFRVEEYHGNMPRWKFRLMLHRNDFYLRIAVSSDLEKLLQKYWHYFHAVLPTLIPTAIQDEKSRMAWIIQHLTFMHKQEKKKRLRKLVAADEEEELDLNHLEDLEDLSEWSSDEESVGLSVATTEESSRPRSESEITYIEHSPPKHSTPLMNRVEKLKHPLVPETKSHSDSHFAIKQTSPTSPKQNDNSNTAEHTDSHNNNNLSSEENEDLQNRLQRSNSLPNAESATEEVVAVLPERKHSKWRQFFKRKPEDAENSEEGTEDKNPEGKKLERDDASRLSVYASIDRPVPKSPSIFKKKLKKKSEQDAADKEGTASQESDPTMAYLKGVIEELFDEDAPRDVRTSKYCILGVLFAIVYAFFLRYSSFDLFMVLLIVLNIGIVYIVKERRTLISFAAKRKLRKVVRQEKRKFLGWLPNSNSTQKEAAKEKEKEKEREKEKEVSKEEEKEPSGAS